MSNTNGINGSDLVTYIKNTDADSSPAIQFNEFLYNGLTMLSKIQPELNITPEKIADICKGWIAVVANSVEGLEDIRPYLDSTADLFDVFMVIVHREWHTMMAEVDHEDIFLFPAVNEDGLGFLFGNVERLYQALDISKTDGGVYIKNHQYDVSYEDLFNDRSQDDPNNGIGSIALCNHVKFAGLRRMVDSGEIDNPFMSLILDSIMSQDQE